ncbi:D site-binding protein [Actinocrispum wychmicini]|uniref:Uncharacterized protein n=1 Tax=Actinocrispum wychmicini TaxID=1213861 RepID=A0A4R2JBP1_9PSEU|nr:D site-binding protein [Actinocrispum wychmicini]TCO56911.1 hypothetical protein EV192_106386 [Actinocrispum wychmicini]
MVGGDPGPGSASLAGLIDKAGEEILADLQHYYQVDLRDVLVEGSGLTARRALALVRQLPPESATAAMLRGGPEFRGWGPDRYLTALLIDAVQANTYAFIAANSKRKPPPPHPIERPDNRPQRRGGGFAAMAADRIAAVRRAKQQEGQ